MLLLLKFRHSEFWRVKSVVKEIENLAAVVCVAEVGRAFNQDWFTVMMLNIGGPDVNNNIICSAFAGYVTVWSVSFERLDGDQ